MRLRLLVIVPVLVLGIFGCGGSGSGGSTNEQFFYRFTNIIPFISGVDFLVDKQVQVPNLQYAGHTDYFETDTEEPNMFIDAVDSVTQEIIDAIVITKRRDASVHIYALGVRGGPQQQQPEAQIIPIEVIRTTPQGNARLIVVHGYVRRAGTQTPNIDLLRSGQIQPIVEDMPFANAETVNVPPGTYTLTARFAGLLSGEFLFRRNVELLAGHVYVALLRGVEGQAGALEPIIDIFEEPVFDP
ncbi:MAG: DUF4397 domain-containing protein [Armatimonadetes bacterium]|nr:DUF4397 domain-containing protein [Armatimonadota bacterium]